MTRNILSHSSTHNFDHESLEMFPEHTDLVELQGHLCSFDTQCIDVVEGEM